MKKWILVLCLVACAVSCGCSSLSRSERSAYREIEELGLDTRANEIKTPALAGVLNILPGIGNFYLAVGEGEGSHWLYGVLNLLTWPISILWGVPEAVIDAGNINKRETIFYYQTNPTGRRKYDEAQARSRGK
jgi:hypothetical protein